MKYSFLLPIILFSHFSSANKNSCQKSIINGEDQIQDDSRLSHIVHENRQRGKATPPEGMGDRYLSTLTQQQIKEDAEETEDSSEGARDLFEEIEESLKKPPEGTGEETEDLSTT